jgi:hypothetical protein
MKMRQSSGGAPKMLLIGTSRSILEADWSLPEMREGWLRG